MNMRCWQKIAGRYSDCCKGQAGRELLNRNYG